MPCTLEPYEVEFEEKRLNKKRYGVEVTDAEMLTRVACELATFIDFRYSLAGGVLKSGKFSKEARDWWKRHKKHDRKEKLKGTNANKVR